MSKQGKVWGVGLPCSVFMSQDPTGAWWISVEVDLTELSVAVREAAGDFDDADEVTEEELEVLDKFIEYVGGGAQVAEVKGWEPR